MAFDGVDVRAISPATHAGAMNMALDEVAAATVSGGGPATVRVYGWEPSCLSLGYGQPAESVAWAWCEAHDIDVTRRPTGGGGIYHDAIGDIAYSIIAPRSVLPGDLIDCYHVLCEPVLVALERMGVDATFASTERAPAYEPACYLREVHPAHDVVVASPEGERKLSGNAQHRLRDAVVQHGSLLYRNCPERHLACFSDCPVDLEGYAARVTSIEEEVGLSRAEVIEILSTSLQEWASARAGEWSTAERDRATTLVAEKFDHPAWIRETRDLRADVR